jgi:hypothetical protein
LGLAHAADHSIRSNRYAVRDGDHLEPLFSGTALNLSPFTVVFSVFFWRFMWDFRALLWVCP